MHTDLSLRSFWLGNPQRFCQPLYLGYINAPYRQRSIHCGDRPTVQVSPTVAGARIFISIVACIGRRHG
jgi:hypothetical protein